MPSRLQYIFPDWGVDVSGLMPYPAHAQPSNVMFNLMLEIEDLTRLREFETSYAGANNEWWSPEAYDAAADVRGTAALARLRMPIFRFGADRDVAPTAFLAGHDEVRLDVGLEVAQAHECLRRVEYILERRGRGLEDGAGRLPWWALGPGASRDPTRLLRGYLANVRAVCRQLDYMTAVVRQIDGGREGPGPAPTLEEETAQWVTIMDEYNRKQECKQDDKDDEFHYGFRAQ
ncbi:hypothetical protein RB601_002040 [Gaeumannomyces tritici]